MQNCSSSESLRPIPFFRFIGIIPHQKLNLSLAPGFNNTMWFLSQSLHTKFTATQQFLMGPWEEKHHFERAGMGRSSAFPVFFRNAHLSAQRVGGLKEPPPSSHSSVTQRQLHRKTSFLSAILPHCSSSSLHPFLSAAHSFTHTHTHSQAVISILMDAQENVNVTKWEIWGEKKNTSVDIEKVRLWNGRAALYPQHSPGWLWVWSGCWWVWINLLNTARPQGLNPSDWWIQGKSRWSRFHWFHLFFLVWKVVSSLVALTLFFFIHLYFVSQALS